MKYQIENWQGIVFLSRADEVLFSLGWQSSRDSVSIKILVPITSLGWHQEGYGKLLLPKVTRTPFQLLKHKLNNTSKKHIAMAQLLMCTIELHKLMNQNNNVKMTFQITSLTALYFSLVSCAISR